MICDKCGRSILGDSSSRTFSVWIWVLADIPEETEDERRIDLDELVEEVTHKLGPLPDYMVASEVFSRKRYRICSRCKEQFLANPLNQ